ncbi:MAG: VOC family protein [Rhizobacter sp.]|nr:VOC family protein [Rhizobacter sp.]
MTQAIASLSLDGKCAEAMRFYEQALHGKPEMMMSGADSRRPRRWKELADRVLRATRALPAGGVLCGGDVRASPPPRRHRGGSRSASSTGAAGRAGHRRALRPRAGRAADGADGLWAKRFGIVAECYGTLWIVSGEPRPF